MARLKSDTPQATDDDLKVKLQPAWLTGHLVSARCSRHYRLPLDIDVLTGATLFLSRTMRQAPLSSTVHGGGKRRCIMRSRPSWRDATIIHLQRRGRDTR